MIELKFNNKLDTITRNILLHNTTILKDGEYLIVRYKNIDFKLNFESETPNITYYGFWEFTYLNKPLPKQIKSEYAIIIEGEDYRGFDEAKPYYETVLGDNFTNNIDYLFTQTIFKWNIIAGIRWFKEYESLSKLITHPYNFGYFIGRKTPLRVGLGNLLSEHEYCFVNHWNNDDYNPSTMKCTHLNDLYGKNDFDNLVDIFPSILNAKSLPNILNDKKDAGPKCWSMDYFFRLLPKVKVLILDETHSDVTEKRDVNFLSEKTFGTILANVPFIPTNVHTLDMIHQIIEIKSYPFYSEIKEISANPQLINNFIVNFNKNFDINYNIIKEWSNSLHNIVLDRLYNENSLFEYFKNNSKKLL